MRRIEESDTSTGSLFGLNPGARYHHVVYDEQTGEIMAISRSHATEGFRQENTLAVQLRKKGKPVSVGFLDIGEPYMMRGDSTRLAHGLNDLYHLNSNARCMMERVQELEIQRAAGKIPETRLATSPEVWIA